MKIKARTDDLIVQEVADETLVYDLKSNQAHCLNSTAAFVWRRCDGRHSMEEIVRLMQAELNTPASDQLVSVALHQLQKAQLLEEKVPTSAVSRRELARRLGQMGAIAALVPAVLSITAPPAAAANSVGCLANGNPCPSATSCCSGKCVNSICSP